MNKFLMLRVLTACNWRCSYCEYGRSPSSNIDDGLAIDIFNKNKDVATHITGGEPGLLSEKFWDNAFSYKPLGVITNGTFIKRGYYEKYRDRVSGLYVHAVQELDHEIDPVILDFFKNNKDPRNEISFVVHRRNTSLIKTFLDKYSDISFKITMSGDQFSNNTLYNLDRESALEVISVLKDYPQYQKYVNKLFLAIVKNNWNLCFMSQEKSCLTCNNKCWKQNEPKAT